MLLQLPRELLEQILLNLDPLSFKNCTLVSRELNTFICSSISLQYIYACHVAGVVDNPHCKLSHAERYEALLKREKAWSRLQPVFTKTFDVKIRSSTIYDLTAGVYLQGHINYRDLYYCTLPSTINDVPQWNAINAHGPSKDWTGEIIDMGMAVYEHDLIVNVISSQLDNRGSFALEMVLLQFSTGEYHPLAQHSRIFVQDSSLRRPAIAVEIVGDNLALVVNNGGRINDKLHIFDWKTGHRKLSHKAIESAYATLVFVSTEILVVPNVILGHYEVWKIPEEIHNVPYQILSLQLPTLSTGNYIFALSCRGEPNPYLHDIPHAPPRPFHCSADSAIIVTIIRLVILGSTFTLVMHRRALLDTITKLASPDTPFPADIPRQSNDALITESVSNIPAHSLSSAILKDAPTLGECYNWCSIPWSEWGPPISRWFDGTRSLTRWITVSAGQRWAVLNRVDSGKYRISIIDFNPHNLHRVPPNLPGTFVVERGGTFSDHHGAFAADVQMGLGCTVYTAPEVYNFDGLLMEEERLLGLKTNTSGNVEKITIFHFD